VRRIEKSGGLNFHEQAVIETPRQKRLNSAVLMANELRADAILVFTLRRHSGAAHNSPEGRP
jgi:hypothetical protein